jgi:ribonuclease H2 subunit A
MADSQPDSQEMALDSQPDAASSEPQPTTSTTFVPPSIHRETLLSGTSYSHYTPLPPVLSKDPATEVCLGIDEAGRGPVLGSMVYAALYLPLSLHTSLLATTYHFDDSKVLTPSVRSNLLALLCKPSHPLYEACGWAVKLLSAQDISSGMMRANGAYNLNAQAMDATVELIKGVIARGVNVREIYIDTVGHPGTYQKKLERIFPTVSITVAKKADSLYPCVSAASVCAKVTRDVALDVCYEAISQSQDHAEGESWGSGYPSDGRCTAWLRRNMDPVFGWGNETRFSWGTAKDMLEAKGAGLRVDWPEEDDDGEGARLTEYFEKFGQSKGEGAELRDWFGTAVGMEVF